MNKTLLGLVDVLCVVYLNDILIYSSELQEHYNHVKEVLEWLRSTNLYVKLSKYKFDITIVNFLRYVISTDGVAIEQD